MAKIGQSRLDEIEARDSKMKAAAQTPGTAKLDEIEKRDTVGQTTKDLIAGAAKKVVASDFDKFNANVEQYQKIVGAVDTEKYAAKDVYANTNELATKIKLQGDVLTKALEMQKKKTPGTDIQPVVDAIKSSVDSVRKSVDATANIARAYGKYSTEEQFNEAMASYDEYMAKTPEERAEIDKQNERAKKFQTMTTLTKTEDYDAAIRNIEYLQTLRDRDNAEGSSNYKGAYDYRVKMQKIEDKYGTRDLDVILNTLRRNKIKNEQDAIIKELELKYRGYEKKGINLYELQGNGGMTEDEYYLYRGILDSGNKEDAERYKQAVNIKYQQAQQEAISDGVSKVYEWIDDLPPVISEATNVLANILTIPVNIIGGALDLIGNAEYAATGDISKEYMLNTVSNVAQTYREKTAVDIQNDLEKAGANETVARVVSGGYQAAMSGVDSLAIMLVSRAAGSAALANAIQVGYTASMGGSAASREAIERYEKGYEGKEIALAAVGAGVCEALFEKVSLEQVLDARKFKNLFVSAAISAGVEGSEELFTNWGNRIWQSIVLAGNTDLDTEISELMAQGYTEKEARKEAWKNAAIEDIESFLGGAFSGGLSGMLVSGVERVRYTEQISNIADRLADMDAEDLFVYALKNEEILTVGTNDLLKQMVDGYSDAQVEELRHRLLGDSGLAIAKEMGLHEKYGEEKTEKIGDKAFAPMASNTEAQTSETSVSEAVAEESNTETETELPKTESAVKTEITLDNSTESAEEALLREASDNKSEATLNREAVQALGKELGFTVIFDDGLVMSDGVTPASGQINYNKGTITLNPNNTNGTRAIFRMAARGVVVEQSKVNRTIKHEATHTAESTKRYSSFVKSVQKSSVYKAWLIRQAGVTNGSINHMEAQLKNRIMDERTKVGENLSNTEAMQEIICDFCGDVLYSGQIEELLADVHNYEEKRNILQFFKDILARIRRAFAGKNAKLVSEIRDLEKRYAKMLSDVSKAEQANARENVERYSFDDGEYKKPITLADILALRAIGRKSINDFTEEDLQRAQKWAYKFYQELGTKSPFFRAWFGDFRAAETKTVRIATIPKYVASNEARKVNRGTDVNTDTGWDIRISREGETNTISHSGIGRLSEFGLAGIKELVENAILLDSEVHEHHSNNAANDHIAFDHKLYALGKDSNGNVGLYRITIEESYHDAKHTDEKVFHNLKYIEKVASVGGRTAGQSLPGVSTSDNNATDFSISDLYSLVKKYDSEFHPGKSVHPALLNEDGTPKAFYHGTDAEFTVFDYTKGRSTMDIQGMFFSPWELDAAGYGKSVGEYYLNIKNPASESVAYAALRKFQGQNDAGKKAREYLIERGYDGVNNSDEELIAFYPEQIKSATDNIGTFSRYEGDIRYSYDAEEERSLDTMTEEQYNAFGWVSANDVIDYADLSRAFSNFSDFKKQNFKFLKGRFARAGNNVAIFTGENNNIVVFFDEKSDIDKPVITEIYVDTFGNDIQEEFLEEMSNLGIEVKGSAIPKRVIETLWKNGIITGYSSESEQSFFEFKEGREQRKSRRTDSSAPEGRNDGGGNPSDGGTGRERGRRGGSKGSVRYAFDNGGTVEGTVESTEYEDYETDGEPVEGPIPSNENLEDTDYTAEIRAVEEQYKAGEITLGRFVDEINRIRAKAVEEKGALESGEKVTDDDRTDVKVPKSVREGTRVRRFARTVVESGDINDATRTLTMADILASSEHSYTPISNGELTDEAYNKVLKDARAAEGEFRAAAEAGKITPQIVALGEAIMLNADRNGDVAKFIDISATLEELLTTAGQSVQAASVFKRSGPYADILYVKKATDRVNKMLKRNYGTKYPPVVLDDAILEQIGRARTQDERDEAVGKAMEDIGQQLPATWIDKWNAWRYMSMLANPKTMIRNLVGNTIFVPMIKAKNVIGYAAEASLYKAGKLSDDQRTKALKIDKKYSDFAKTDAEEMENVLRSGGKYNPSNAMYDARRIFKSKALEAVRHLYGDILENTDALFLKGHYRSALASYLQAQNINLDASTNPHYNEQMEKARTYAINEALKATYRDASSLASALNQLTRDQSTAGRKFISFVIESAFPFKKTPVNILKRGIEYSPLGIIRTIGQYAYEGVQKNRIEKYSIPTNGKTFMTASQFIDGISAGMTGTMVLLLGAFLASQGIVKMNLGDDEKDESFEKMLGRQDYSIELFGRSFTIDWAAPACIPFFIGAAIQESSANKESFTDTFAKASLSALDVITETSMLDGINRFLDSVQYKQNGENAIFVLAREIVTSYFGQAIPTVTGKIANVIDTKSRNAYYVDKTSNVPKIVQDAINYLKARTPGWSMTLPEKVNAWGETESSGNIVERVADSFLSPGYTNKITEDDIDRELKRIEEATGDAGVLPKKPSKYFTVNGFRRDLTAKEYMQFSKDVGQKSHELVVEAMQNANFNALDDVEKADIIKKLYTYAMNVARSNLSYTYDEFKNMGVAVATEAEYNALTPEKKKMLYEAKFLTGTNATAAAADRKGESVVDVFVNTEKKSTDSSANKKQKTLSDILG